MLQWRILVLGVMRLGLNADYDRVQDLANNHRTMRQMLGHGEWTATFEYKTQTLKDNLQLMRKRWAVPKFSHPPRGGLARSDRSGGAIHARNSGAHQSRGGECGPRAFKKKGRRAAGRAL
jgi:hypothetical protein